MLSGTGIISIHRATPSSCRNALSTLLQTYTAPFTEWLLLVVREEIRRSTGVRKHTGAARSQKLRSPPLPLGTVRPMRTSEEFRLWIFEGSKRQDAFAHMLQQRERNWQLWQAQPKLGKKLSRSMDWRTS